MMSLRRVGFRRLDYIRGVRIQFYPTVADGLVDGVFGRGYATGCDDVAPLKGSSLAGNAD